MTKQEGANLDMTFGEFIRQTRIRTFPGLSLSQFARQRIQISAPYLSSVETGRVAPPSIDIVLRLAAVLHVDRLELLRRAGYSDPEKLKEARLKTPPESSELVETMRQIARDYGYGYTFKVKDFVAVVLGRYLMSGTDISKADLIEFIESIAEVVKKPRRFFPTDIRECARVGSEALEFLGQASEFGHRLPDWHRKERGCSYIPSKSRDGEDLTPEVEHTTEEKKTLSVFAPESTASPIDSQTPTPKRKRRMNG
jgi:transcriptional regulator with XRE-family HTH domain